MIAIGQIQTMVVDFADHQQILLKGEEDVLVPLCREDISSDIDKGDELDVFVYFNKQDELTATVQTPLITAEHFALLEIVSVTPSGAFADIGIEKDLFIPKPEQYKDLEEGEKVIIYMYFDVISQKLVGSSRYDEYTESDDVHLDVGQEVELLVVRRTDLGYVVIVDQMYEGLVYHNDVFKNLQTGDVLPGFVRKVRDDFKIDVSLRAFGYRKVESELDRIMKMLDDHDGILYYTDKTDPQIIRDVFNMSKKVFKKSIGALYKQKLIIIEEDAIRLNK